MTEEFDLIVIGGGSAGCAMTGRLAEHERFNVLLLEAGKSDRHYRSLIPALTSAVVQNPDFDWCYKTEPDTSVGGRADIWPGGKRLGGGSAINGMMFIRGHAWDFDHWSELGADGWDYASVLPYFRRMEDNERGETSWRGVDGPLSVSEVRARFPVTDAWIEAAVNAGIERSDDLNGAVAEGVDYVQLTQCNGLRCSSAAAYIHRSRHRNRLAVRTEAQVLRILIEDGRAVGVVYRRGGETHTVRSRRGVVLSAGAMNSPRILMLSGLGPADHLRDRGVEVVHDLQGVGQNLQDHVGTHLVNDVNVHTLNSEARGLPAARQVLRFLAARRGILTTGIAHAHAYVRSRSGLPVPNLQIAFSAFSFDLDETGRLVLRYTPAVSTLVGLMRISERGEIRLRSNDPLAPPVIDHRLLGSDDDLEQIVEGIEIARRIVSEAPMAGLVTGEVRPGADVADRDALRQYVRAAAIPLYHPVGTCKMGRDEMAVVDPDLKVRGVEGLWVADASVMPSLPAGNTNAASIMVGDKGAAHILKDIADTPMVQPVEVARPDKARLDWGPV